MNGWFETVKGLEVGVGWDGDVDGMGFDLI